MSLTSVQLWERIHKTGLATSEDCRKWAIEISLSRPPEFLQDQTKLAAELIRLGKITSFQANVLVENSHLPLAIGPFRIRESLETTFGPNWLLALDSSRSKPPSRWCYLLTFQDLHRPEMQKWPPSLELAEKQVAINHPSIDKWIFCGTDKNSFVAFSETLEGQSLTAGILYVDGAWVISLPLSFHHNSSVVSQPIP